MRGYDSHRCEGSLDARCSIRKAEHRKSMPFREAWMRRDGRWHLYAQEWNSEYDVTYMSEVAAIRYCPWCGEEL